MRLAPESPDYVHHESKNDAEQNASGQRKIECRVPAAIDDVTGEASNWEIRFAEQNQDQPYYEQHAAQEYKQFAHIRHKKSVNHFLCGLGADGDRRPGWLAAPRQKTLRGGEDPMV